MKINMALNNDKSGVELRFSSKPDESIREKMKTLGFRYSRAQNMWYAKQAEETLAFAQSICSSDEGTSMPAAGHTSPFYPSYDTVNGVNIYPSASGVSVWDERGGYFADISALIKHSSDHVMILDLTNALKPGLVCKVLRIHKRDRNDPRVITGDAKTYADLYAQLFDRHEIPDGCDAYESEEKSMRTFSPFVQVKPIKTPMKWTLPHVWKAILSGQIYEGTVDGKYSDDYLYDAATNFSTGLRMHLPSFAAELIESPSGWYVSVDERTETTAQLSVNCHSFDMRTVRYEESCTHEEGKRRREKAQQALEDSNNALLRQQLTAVESDPQRVYSIDYLQMDDNTDQYNVRTVQTTGGFVRQDCTYGGCPIIKQAEVLLADDAMYPLYSFNHRPLASDDKRLIWLDEWTVYVTGLALREMLSEGYRNDEIGKATSHQEFAEMLSDRCTGRVSVMFGNKVDYAEMADRYRHEQKRVRKGTQFCENDIALH